MIFPRRCPFCDGVMPPGELSCRPCREKLSYVGEHHCMKCGKQLQRENAEYCHDCERTGHVFTRGRSLYVYDDAVRRSIAGFKYHNRREYAEFYAYDLARHLGGFLECCRPSCLIPVPVSKAKLKKRGYDQSEILSEAISADTGIPVLKNYVIRCRDTLPMKDLSRSERMKNLRGAFKITAHDVKCRSVLIVDDIYTTGSTMDSMSTILKEAGAEEVYFVTLAAGSTL